MKYNMQAHEFQSSFSGETTKGVNSSLNLAIFTKNLEIFVTLQILYKSTNNTLFILEPN